MLLYLQPYKKSSFLYFKHEKPPKMVIYALRSNDSVAQLVEHYTFNVRVLGSNPSGITNTVINLNRFYNRTIEKNSQNPLKSTDSEGFLFFYILSKQKIQTYLGYSKPRRKLPVRLPKQSCKIG